MNIMKSKKINRYIGIIMVLGMLLSVMPIGMVGFAASDPSDVVISSYTVTRSEINYNETFSLNLTLSLGAGISGVSAVLTGDNFVSTSGVVKFNAAGTTIANIPLKYVGGADKLTVNFLYTKVSGAPAVTTSESLAGSVKIAEVKEVSTSGSSGSSTPTDTSKYKPTLQVKTDGKVPTMTAGVDSEFKLNIENTGKYSAKKIKIELVDSGKEFPFVTENVTNSINIEDIKTKSTIEVVFPVKVKPTAKPKNYPITLKYTLENNYGDTSEITETVYVKIFNNAVEPILGIIEQKYKNEKVIAGTEDAILLRFKNAGTLTATNIRVQLSGFKADEIKLNNDMDVKVIDQITKGQDKFVYFNIKTPETLKSGTYTMNAKLTYYDEAGDEHTKELPVYIPVDGVESGIDSITIEDIVSPSQITAGKGSTIKATVKNNSESEQKDLKITLSSDANLIFKTPYIKKIKTLAAGESQEIEFSILTKKDQETNNYPTYIKLEKAGVEVGESITEYLGLFIEGVTGTSKPKIIVEKYDIGGENVLAGEEFDLVITFLNTSNTMGIQNAKVTLSTEDSVFSPVDAANSFFIQKISPKGTAEHTIRLKSKNDAAFKMFNVTAEIEYEDAKGNSYDAEKNAYKATEIMGVNVIQEMRLVVSEIYVPFEAYVGIPINLEAEFFNKGKSDMKNMMVNVEGDFTVQDSNYYVGDFNPSRTEYFSAKIIPTEIGTRTGKVVFEFEDLSGNIHTEEKIIELNVVEGSGDSGMNGMEGMNGGEFPIGEGFPEDVEFEMDPETGMPIIDPETGMPKIKEPKGKNTLYIGIGVLIAAAAAAIIILRKRKMKRLLMEEEDEE